MEVVTGYVEHIVFRNEENGYTVFRLENDGGEITCVGNFNFISEGEMMELRGEYTNHSVYGLQLKVSSHTIKEPEDVVSIERYLGSGAVKGVGQALAGRIVKKFREDTFRIIEEEPERLAEVKGISERKAREIAEQVEEKKDMRKAMITDCLVEIFRPRGIFERSDVALRKKEGLSEVKGVLYGEVPDIAEIEENGLKMLVDIKNGQKTGYFLDQKENRFAARRYAAGGEVLDCFCNSGGFSLNCATVAKHVTACDISQAALDNVMRNARLNGLENIDTVCGDAFELLRFFRRSGRKFDLVILDPPAFCKSAAEVKDAYRGYKDINLQGMKLVGSGGFLITCSCSHYMTATLFERMLAEAAKESGRVVKSVEVRTQAPDHPSLLCADETHYLKFYVLNII